MSVTSKFRTLYFAKYIFVYSIVFAIIIVLLFLVFTDKEFTFLLPVALIVLAILISYSIGFLNLSRITLSEEGIVNEALFRKKKTFISYIQIEKISSERIRSRVKGGGYINDGYTEARLNLKDGKVLIISQDCYENYADLIAALFQYHKKETLIQ